MIKQDADFYHLRCIIMVPLTHLETQALAIILQINSKWTIEETEVHRLSIGFFILLFFIFFKKRKAGTTERKLNCPWPDFTLHPTVLPMEPDWEGEFGVVQTMVF